MDVRRGICPFIERAVDSSSLSLLEARLEREEDGEVRGGLLRALGAAGRSEARRIIEPYLDDEDPEIRRGALVAMLRYCGARAGDQAARDLGALVRSHDIEQRIVAARPGIRRSTARRLRSAKSNKASITPWCWTSWI